MALDLIETVLSGRRLYGGSEIELAAGEKFRIQKQVGGQLADELVLQTVPQGKAWAVEFRVYVTESDA